MTQHQIDVAKRMRERAVEQLVFYSKSLEFAQDVERWGEDGNQKMYDRARLGVLKWREKVAKLDVKLAGGGG